MAAVWKFSGCLALSCTYRGLVSSFLPQSPQWLALWLLKEHIMSQSHLLLWVQMLAAPPPPQRQPKAPSGNQGWWRAPAIMQFLLASFTPLRMPPFKVQQAKSFPSLLQRQFRPTLTCFTVIHRRPRIQKFKRIPFKLYASLL